MKRTMKPCREKKKWLLKSRWRETCAEGQLQNILYFEYDVRTYHDTVKYSEREKHKIKQQKMSNKERGMGRYNTPKCRKKNE